MILLFLTEANLRDRLFVQSFVHNYKLDQKALLILDAFGGTVRDTRFVTKRLSTLLSEEMVYNNAFTADQRDFFQEKEGVWEVRKELIEQLMAHIQLLIIGPVVNEASGPGLADPKALIAAAREQLPVSEVWVFTDNPLSPLGKQHAWVEKPEDVMPLLKAYEEESPAISLALELAPARLVSAGS